MWFKSSFTTPAVVVVGLCLVGGTVPAVADTIHVPGDYPTIQEAIDAAMDGDEVEVDPGTYNETIDFLGKAITVYSTDGPDVTIIDAQGFGRVITCDSGEGPDTVIEGFTITGGDAVNGGGMGNFSGSSPIVVNCRFIANCAILGGGMANFGGGSPLIMGCWFVANEGSGTSGMHNGVSSPIVVNCNFIDNDFGPAMGNAGSSAIVAGCLFVDNFGGAMSCVGGLPIVANCTLTQNGGGITIFGSPTITNCILWGNFPGEIVVNSGEPVVNYSCIQDGWAGAGSNNIDADPMFVDPDNGDFRLSSGSPCIDAGNNWGVPIDENDFDEDGVLCELFPVDLDGNPRFNADEADFDPSCGVPVVVDMGAYEYQFAPVDQVTFADLNGDDAVGAADLLGLLASWGPCGKGCCLADLNIDGIVGASDLLILLANWGPCP